MPDFVYVTANAGGKARHAELEGRKCLVVPTTILTEGVHAGSNGPLFYSKEELGRFPSAWNHKPLVIYHPKANGNYVTACSPTVLNTRKCGVMLNTVFNGKLRTESWFDVERTKAIDARVYDAVSAGKTMEVSTGLHYEEHKVAGEFGGEKYSAAVTNMQPDHLAILPDEVGACSVAKGAGLFQVNATREAEGPLAAWRRSLVHRLAPLGVQLVDNALSFDDTSRMLSDALGAKYGTPGKYWGGYVVTVYPDTVIFRCEDDNVLMSVGYTATDAGVELSGDAVEVKRVVSYQTMSGAVLVENSQGLLIPKETTMAFDKKAHITGLIGNGWVEADRPELEKMSDAVLEKIKPTPPVVNTTPVVPPVVPPILPAVNVGQVTPTKTVTLEEYVGNAPLEIQEVLVNGVNTHNAEKATLIATILANKTNVFTAETLNGMKNAQLKGIAALAAPPAPVANSIFLGANALPGPVPATIERLKTPE